MKKIKLLSDEEAEHYIKQIDRRGKAKKLPAEKLDAYKKAYNEITEHLNANFKGFLVHFITSGKNVLSEPALLETINKAEKSGLFDRIRNSLSEGNSEEFVLRCFALKFIYSKAIYDESKREMEYNKIMSAC